MNPFEKYNTFIVLVQHGLLAKRIEMTAAVRALAVLVTPVAQVYFPPDKYEETFNIPNFNRLADMAIEYVNYVAGEGPVPSWFDAYWRSLPKPGEEESQPEAA